MVNQFGSDDLTENNGECEVQEIYNGLNIHVNDYSAESINGADGKLKVKCVDKGKEEEHDEARKDKNKGTADYDKDDLCTDKGMSVDPDGRIVSDKVNKHGSGLKNGYCGQRLVSNLEEKLVSNSEYDQNAPEKANTEADALLFETDQPRDTAESTEAPNKDMQLDDALSELKFGKFHLKMLILTCGAYFAACAEMLLIVFLSKPVKNEWGIDNMIYPILLFSSGLVSLIGSFVFGSVSDKLGRQKPLLVSLIFIALFGGLSGFMPNFGLFVVMRSLTGFGVSGIEAINFVLLLEFLPRKNRGRVMVVITMCGVLGAVYTATMAWWLLPRYGWRWFVASGAVPAAVVVVYRLVFSYESPRYLYISGRKEEGIKVLQEIARQNNVKLPEANIICAASEERGKIQALFSQQLRGRTFFATIVWFLQSLGYWSVTMYLPEYMTSVNMNPYLNMFLVFMGEIPGILIALYLVEPHLLGRIRCLRLFSFVTVIALLLFAFIDISVFKAVVVVIVYCFMVPIYSILNTFTPEIYPTDTRSIAMAWVYMIIAFPGLISAFIGASVLSTNIPWLYPVVAAAFFGLQFIFTFGLKIEPAGKALTDCKDE